MRKWNIATVVFLLSVLYVCYEIPLVIPFLFLPGSGLVLLGLKVPEKLDGFRGLDQCLVLSGCILVAISFVWLLIVFALAVVSDKSGPPFFRR